MVYKREILSTKKIEPLYIFFHMPKCAGSTFRCHVERNFKKGEAVSICWDGYFDVTSEKYTFFTSGECRKQINAYLSRLTVKQKDKIKILHGHEIYYGIHRFFPDREPRYITFVRCPVVKEVSMYNFSRDRVENPFKYPIKNWNVRQIKILEKVRNDVIHNGTLLSFAECLKKHTWTSNDTFQFLREHGFGNVGMPIVDDLFKEFYFIGITEKYKTDALFLYHLLGIKKFYSDQNISKKYVDAKNLSKELRDFLDERNKKDMRLYEHALFLNKNFKKKSLY